MPHDPALCADVRAWLVKASEDLRAAEHGFRASPALLGVIAFHCQQAAEKALKGFLAWNQVQFRKTHSLEEIGEQCLHLDRTLPAVVDARASDGPGAACARPISSAGPPR
jgi:HEPN domain-containing protein